jgi:hypothetical protein
MVYLMTLSVSGYIALNNWLIVNNELERMRKEAVVTEFKVLHQQLLGGTSGGKAQDDCSDWKRAPSKSNM